MNKYVPLVILFVPFLIPYNVFADNIQSGSSNAQSFVETRIEGNGNVQTHIEVSANGEKKVLDTTGPGTYKLEVQSSNNSNSKTPTSTVSNSPSPISSKTAIVVEKELNKDNAPTVLNFITNFKNSINDLFKLILNFLKI